MKCNPKRQFNIGKESLILWLLMDGSVCVLEAHGLHSDEQCLSLQNAGHVSNLLRTPDKMTLIVILRRYDEES